MTTTLDEERKEVKVTDRTRHGPGRAAALGAVDMAVHAGIEREQHGRLRPRRERVWSGHPPLDHLLIDR